MLTRRSILAGLAACLAGLKLPQVLYPIVRRLPHGGFYAVSEPQFVGKIPPRVEFPIKHDDSDIEAFYAKPLEAPVEPVRHFVTVPGSALATLGTATHLGSPAWRLFQHLAVERKPAESEHVRALERQLQATGIVGLLAVRRHLFDPDAELFSLRMLTADDVHERDVLCYRCLTDPTYASVVI